MDVVVVVAVAVAEAVVSQFCLLTDRAKDSIVNSA